MDRNKVSAAMINFVEIMNKHNLTYLEKYNFNVQSVSLLLQARIDAGEGGVDSNVADFAEFITDQMNINNSPEHKAAMVEAKKRATKKKAN